MSVRKYDDEKIKQEYLKSKEMEVRSFLMSYLGLSAKAVKSTFWSVKTRGWSKEKKEILKKQSVKFVEEMSNDPKLQVDVKNISIAIRNIEKKVAKLLGGMEEFKKDDLPKVKIGWEMLKVSIGEAPNLVSSNNTNTDRVVISKEIDKKIKEKINDAIKED